MMMMLMTPTTTTTTIMMVMMMMMMMMIIIILIIIIIIIMMMMVMMMMMMMMMIAFKGAIQDCLQSPHCAYAQVAGAQSCANHMQHIERSARATCRVPRGTTGQLSC